MELLKITTVTYFLKCLLTISSDWACLILLLGFLVMLAYQHWVKLWSFLLQFLQYFSSWLDRISSNVICLNGNVVQAFFFKPLCVLFIVGFRTWDLPFVLLRGIGGWLASDFSNLSHTWFLDRFWVALDRNYSLIVLCQLLESQSLFVFKFGQYPPSDFSVFCSSNIKHLKSSQSARLVWNHYRACLPMLQTLENLAGCPWLCSGIFNVCGTRLC